MSIKVMDEVFIRLVRDKDFRELLRRDPEQALADYDLTPEERAAFARLSRRSRRKPGHSVSLN